MGKFEMLIGVAGIIGLLSFSTLLERIYKTHNTESLPWAWVYMNLTGQTLSFMYGIINLAYGIFIPNFLFLCGLSYIFYVKVTYGENGKIKEEKEAFNQL